MQLVTLLLACSTAFSPASVSPPVSVRAPASSFGRADVAAPTLNESPAAPYELTAVPNDCESSARGEHGYQ